MTWWAPSQVLAIARRVGWDHDAAALAATVATVATQGADHYRWDIPGVEGSRQRGLWALSDVQLVDGGGGDPMDPMVSGRVARQLWIAAGHKWDWHPVVAADGGRLVTMTLENLDQANLWGANASHLFGIVGDLRRLATQPRRSKASLGDLSSWD